MIEKSKEEKKVEAEAELERIRLVHNIMTQRVRDPPGMNKCDPSKHYNYETIEANVVSGFMHEFSKVPKKRFDIENSDFN